MRNLKFLIRRFVHVALIFFWLISLGLNLMAVLSFPGLDWRHRLIGISGGFSTVAFLGLYVLQKFGNLSGDAGTQCGCRYFEIGEPPGGIDEETRKALDDDWHQALRP